MNHKIAAAAVAVACVTAVPAAAQAKPAPCKVPRLAGLTLSQARFDLNVNHCQLGLVAGPRAGRVKSQSYWAGRTLRHGARIDVMLAMPKRPTVTPPAPTPTSTPTPPPAPTPTPTPTPLPARVATTTLATSSVGTVLPGETWFFTGIDASVSDATGANINSPLTWTVYVNGATATSFQQPAGVACAVETQAVGAGLLTVGGTPYSGSCPMPTINIAPTDRVTAVASYTGDAGHLPSTSSPQAI